MPFSFRQPKRTPPPAFFSDSPVPPVAQRSTGIELVVGLGNPGGEYAGNRHNAGYRVVNRLARRTGIKIERHSKTASTGEGSYAGRRLVLAKPRTFMNNSGNAVAELLRRYYLQPEQVLLVYDDLDLPAGRVRVRENGSHGGQKGMRSIVAATGSENFPRIRIGIGRPNVGGKPSWDPEVIAGWVLSDPAPDDRRLLDEAANRAAEAVICCLDEGVETAMNKFNHG